MGGEGEGGYTKSSVSHITELITIDALKVYCMKTINVSCSIKKKHILPRLCETAIVYTIARRHEANSLMTVLYLEYSAQI